MTQMSHLAIRVEGLGKRYQLGEIQRYKALRDTLARAAGAPWRALRAAFQGSSPRSSRNVIWALKDVSFSVAQGDVVGVIGRNGAGKSTLLRILSRITEPTEGYADIAGRVGSLLEVGTGFHPELTGRENIYLNGAILGMTRREITRRFEEIVAFAEVERFLDTPVKHYSSGMYMRLAFSVAAHLEPDILLVDEVLAVGDAAFQKKCLGKMGEVASAGRTVIFVSHNISAVLGLCRRAIWIEQGHLVADGPPSHVIEQYMASTLSVSAGGSVATHSRREGTGRIRFDAFAVDDGQGNPWLSANRPAVFRLTLRMEGAALDSSKVNVAIGVNAASGERVLELHTKFDPAYHGQPTLLNDRMTIVCTTRQFPLRAGTYVLTLYVDYAGELCDRIRDGIKVDVQESDYFGTGASLSRTQGWYYLSQRWAWDGECPQAPVALERDCAAR